MRSIGSTLLVIIILLWGCGTESTPADPTDVESLDVQDVWVRAMPDTIATLTAAYGEIINNTPALDELVAVTIDVSGSTELHETTIVDDVMRMREVESILIPPGSTVSLAPGGHHVMLMGLDRQLVDGASVQMVFEFSSGVTVAVTAPVRSN